MSTMQRQKLISKKMKAKGIKVESVIPNKKYDSSEVYELIQIANCFTELREMNRQINRNIINKYKSFKNARNST